MPIAPAHVVRIRPGNHFSSEIFSCVRRDLQQRSRPPSSRRNLLLLPRDERRPDDPVQPREQYRAELQSRQRPGRQHGVQAKAVGLTAVWSGVVAFIAYKLVALTIGLRVPEEEEREGLDVSSHGEAAYRM